MNWLMRLWGYLMKKIGVSKMLVDLSAAEEDRAAAKNPHEPLWIGERKEAERHEAAALHGLGVEPAKEPAPSNEEQVRSLLAENSEMREELKRYADLRVCSYCGIQKTPENVMVAGKFPGARICEACLGDCTLIVAETKAARRVKAALSKELAAANALRAENAELKAQVAEYDGIMLAFAKKRGIKEPENEQATEGETRE